MGWLQGQAQPRDPLEGSHCWPPSKRETEPTHFCIHLLNFTDAAWTDRQTDQPGSPAASAAGSDTSVLGTGCREGVILLQDELDDIN